MSGFSVKELFNLLTAGREAYCEPPAAAGGYNALMSAYNAGIVKRYVICRTGGKRAFMLAETVAASLLWLILLFTALSMFACVVNLYAAADRRLKAEEHAALALACLAAGKSPAEYAEICENCVICGLTASCYAVKECDEEILLLWPDI